MDFGELEISKCYIRGDYNMVQIYVMMCMLQNDHCMYDIEILYLDEWNGTLMIKNRYYEHMWWILSMTVAQDPTTNHCRKCL